MPGYACLGPRVHYIVNLTRHELAKETRSAMTVGPSPQIGITTRGPRMPTTRFGRMAAGCPLIVPGSQADAFHATEMREKIAAHPYRLIDHLPAARATACQDETAPAHR